MPLGEAHGLTSARALYATLRAAGYDLAEAAMLAAMRWRFHAPDAPTDEAALTRLIDRIVA